MLAAGDTLDRYTIQAPLGAGGMGEVYKAYDKRLHRSVAIKVLSSELTAANPVTGGPARMLREARAAAALDHPNVVAIHDAAEAEEPEALAGTVYIVMELIQGRSLRDYIGADVEITQRVGWLSDVARALAAAHARGLVHRDIKPENVMIREDGVLKVLDFGIAKRMGVPVDPSAATEISGGTRPPITTTSGIAIGTPYYMAPEQMRGEWIDGRADQFSWGVMAYELLSGVAPWELSGGGVQLVAQVLSKEPVDLARTAPGAPPAVAAAVMRALSKSRDARFPTMGDLLAAMDAPTEAFAPTSPRIPLDAPAVSPAATTKPPTPSTTTKASERPPPARRRAGPALALGAAAVAGLAVVLLLVGRPHGSQPAAAVAVVSGPAPARGECDSNAACIQAHGGAPFRCARPAGRCAPLASDRCTVHAESDELQRDSTVWIGAMFPLSGADGRDYGIANAQAVELARRDFADTIGKLARADASGTRSIAVVTCDDSEDPAGSAKHLVEDVGVAGIIGFNSSTELMELASTLLLPRGVVAMVALNTSPTITSLPSAPGQPRLIWRTTYNADATVAPLAKFVGAVLEPRVREALGDDATKKPMRVAFLRENAAGPRSLSDAMLKTLVFNGVSAVQNGDDYREIVYGPDAPWSSIVRTLHTFRPHVILYQGDDRMVHGVIEPLERAWPSGEQRPIYATMNPISQEVFGFVGRDAGRRRRFFGLTTVSTTETNASFVTHYNETFSDKITRTIAPNTAYDAFYALAYAVYATGDASPTGVELAKAFVRLRPPGRHLDVGPSAIFDGFTTLRAGGNLDLEGSAGPLDFDLATGEAPVDMVILCIKPDDKGAAFDALESGLVFHAATGELEGAMKCP